MFHTILGYDAHSWPSDLYLFPLNSPADGSQVSQGPKGSSFANQHHLGWWGAGRGKVYVGEGAGAGGGGD